VAQLNQAVRASLTRPETQQRLKQLGAIVNPSSPDEFRSWLTGDAQRWTRVIKAAGVKAE
jgi:tripartite-type tricarboxylate transporter receptor subunit TctC